MVRWDRVSFPSELSDLACLPDALPHNSHLFCFSLGFAFVSMCHSVEKAMKADSWRCTKPEAVPALLPYGHYALSDRGVQVGLLLCHILYKSTKQKQAQPKQWIRNQDVTGGLNLHLISLIYTEIYLCSVKASHKC